MKKKQKKGIYILFAVGIILLLAIIIEQFLFQSTLGITDWGIQILVISVTLILLLFITMYLFGNKGNSELRHQDKLFKSLRKNSNTIYIMANLKKEQLIYMSENANEILEIRSDELERTSELVIAGLFQTPSIQNELHHWDKKSELVSQMFSFDTPNAPATKWLRIQMYPFEEKKQEYVVILISDVTKEHDQQHLLVVQARDVKNREQQLNQITNVSYDVEMNINVTTGKYEFHNLKLGIDYFGQDRSGIYQSELVNLVETYLEKEDQKKVLETFSLEHFELLAKEGNLEPLTIRYRLRTNDEPIWLESTAFFTTIRGMTQVTILAKNVTENAEQMRKQNGLLEQALKEAKQASMAKTEFLRVVSHEIRTPLNAMIGFSESALKEEVSKVVREDLESINSASNNLLEIIDGILNISKVESGILSLEEREYQVSRLLKDLEGIAKERVGKKKIKIKMEADPNIPAKLLGDVVKIRQVLMNLIDNAAKYTKEGSITIHAHTVQNSSMAKLIISIADTGSGMDENTLSELFQPNSSKQQGMGLEIAKKMINCLNGEIVAESEVGKGSIFTVSINQKIMSEEKIGLIDDYVAPKQTVYTFNANGKRVLVVDDDSLNLKVAKRLLEPYQIIVSCVSSGQECIDLIEQNETFDLILLDQMMPNMSGTETLTKLRENIHFTTPVVALTADAIVGMKEKYLSAGFSDYLSKPINSKELNDMLKKYLQN